LVAGGTFFFLGARWERRRKLLTKNLDHWREAFRAARRRRPFTSEAMVILPVYLHGLWTLPSRDEDFSSRWHDIKARYAAQIPRGEGYRPDVCSRANGVFGRGVFGRTLSATRAIMKVRWITSITIR